MLPRKKQNRYHRLLLTDAIKNKNSRIVNLRPSFATRPSELEMMSISEDLWEQINKLDQFKDGSYIKDRLKNSLRSFISILISYLY